MIIKATVRALTLFVLASAAFAQTGAPPPSPAAQIRRNYASITRRILDMAKDFPAAKYYYKPTPKVRSFGEVLVHICGGFQYGTKQGSGQKVEWDEIDPKDYKTKAKIVTLVEQQIAASTETLNGWSDERFKESVNPWLAVIEHSAEHYGQLVVYYRLNGLVPPESRPKKK